MHFDSFQPGFARFLQPRHATVRNPGDKSLRTWKTPRCLLATMTFLAEQGTS